jgi:signal transduction histidine kinase/DNA-binding response OmpR family regulator
MSLIPPMTRSILALIACLVLNTTAAQVARLDSLQRQLRLNSEMDTARVKTLNALSQYYQWINFNQSLNYASDALEIAESLSYPLGIATACFRQAHCYWALGDSDLAIEKALRAVSIAEEKQFTTVQAETYRILAICYRDQQEIEKAISYIRHAERLATAEQNWDLLARVYNLAGVIDQTRELYDSALMYYQKSLDLTKQYPIARFHVPQALSNIGELYLKSDPDKGLEYFNNALIIAKEVQNKSAEAGIRADIGRAYIRKSNYSKAEENLQQSLTLARALGLRRVVRHVYLALTDLKIREEKPTEAFNYMRSYYDVRDSLLNGSKTRQIVELETRFEAEQQAQKIRLLEQEKKMQRLWQIVLIAGSLLLLSAAAIIYRLQQLRSLKARQLLETQKALTEKLKETDTLKSKFFASLSHEFRTPLTLILTPVEEQLRNGKLTLPERSRLKMIQRNAHRLLALINQLLDLSKLEAGKMELSIKRGNLTRFLNTLIASFDSLAEHKQIHFVKNISEEPVPIGFDADKIEKIVSNILFNAFKFTPIDGQVIVSMHISKNDNEIVISVSDTGKGIPAEEQSKVFSPFYQLKSEAEDAETGTGLGLSLVYELVQLYQGKIALISEPNKGTCITVLLPVYHSPVSATFYMREIDQNNPTMLLLSDEESEPRNTPQEHAENTILVVEDNNDLRRFIASGFQKRCTVLSATNGEDGLAQALAQIPDVIISDVMMPKINGLELTATLKKDERTCHIPIILLTAKADAPSKMEGLKMGADEYMAKPFSLEELQVRVANVLDQRRKLAAKLKESLMTENEKATVPKEPSLDEKFLSKVRTTIETNLGNSFFTVEILADEMNLSRAQLFRKLKALINTSPSELINDLRLQRAAELISAKADNIAQIGYAVGFNEQSYFSKRFKRKYGVSPTEYKR